MEDLDRARSRPHLAEGILSDLRWLGLDWDEGPDLGGPHEPYEQSARQARYLGAFDRLRSDGRLYPCFCSRKEIAAAASAPQEPGEERAYAGTCRALETGEAQARIESGARHAWRFRVEEKPRPHFEDLLHGAWRGGTWPSGDFVVHRSDGVTAYQLAVVVDDADMGIDEVVRGDDLLPSTLRQIVLYEALGWEPPLFGHVPLLLDVEGVRLSKRQKGITLRELRESGFDSPAIVGRLAHLLGLRPSPGSVRLQDLVDEFSWERLHPAPEGIVVDLSTWGL
jgi:glutamyl-tRNA synthetase